MLKRGMKFMIMMLALFLLVAVRPDNVQAATASGTCGDELVWELDEGVLTISGSGNMKNYSAGKAPWYEHRTRITDLVIESGVTTVGDYAFDDCSRLTDINFGSVTKIGNHSFDGCDALVNVSIPATVTSIGEYGFYHCDRLKTLHIAGDPSMGYRCFKLCTSLTKVTMDKVTTVGSSAFTEDTSLETVSMMSAVTVKDYAFNTCSALKTVYGDNITSIQEYGFVNCESLTTINLSKVTKIGHYAFQYNKSLKDVHISAATTSIGDYAFEHCEGMKTLTIDGDPSIGYRCFRYCTGLTKVVMDSVTTVNSSAFTGDTSLTSVSMLNVKTLKDYAFHECSGLMVLIAPNLRTIEEYAFRNCTKLTSVSFANADSIGQYAFENCEQLVSVNIPNATSIGSYCFVNCKALPSIQMENIESIGSYAFKNCTGLTAIGLSQYLESIGGSAFASTTALKNVFYGGTASDWGTYVSIGGSNTYLQNAKFSYGSCEIVLTINEQPKTQKVKNKNTAYFTVYAIGNGVNYQWQYRTSSNGSWKKCTAEGNQSPILKVAATNAKSGYQYRCKLMDADGNTKYTNTVNLYVLGIKKQPVVQKVVDGDKAVFAVNASGHNKKYQWQYRKSANDSWQSASASGNKKASMTVTASTAKNGYQYRCKITDSAGNVVYSKAVKLYVLGIKKQPASVTIKAGNKAKFTVTATGYDKTYQWQYRTSASGKWKNVTADGNKTNTIKISATRSRNGYQYRCKISDDAGNVIYTKAATLRIK